MLMIFNVNRKPIASEQVSGRSERRVRGQFQPRTLFIRGDEEQMSKRHRR